MRLVASVVRCNELLGARPIVGVTAGVKDRNNMDGFVADRVEDAERETTENASSKVSVYDRVGLREGAHSFESCFNLI